MTARRASRVRRRPLGMIDGQNRHPQPLRQKHHPEAFDKGRLAHARRARQPDTDRLPPGTGQPTHKFGRRHAVIVVDHDTTRVIDWGSKNGVFVNAERITEHFLKNGDSVRIGTADFRYEERPKRDP